MMEFIKDLHEARMIRDANNAKVLTFTDCIERMYLTLLCLEIMRHYPKHRGFVKSYADKTTGKSNYSIFRAFSTDLHNLIYFITGDEDAQDKLKDPGAAKAARKSITLPVMNLNRYLTNLAHDTKPSMVSDLFVKIEIACKISNADYKTIRRVAMGWNSASTAEKERTVTRLLFALRAKLRNSDIIEEFEKLASDKNFEIDRVPDPEPTVSTPDIANTMSKLQYYRYLVGQENIMMAKKFLDNAKNGSSMPSQYVQGYLPIVKMIDDIVQAGPSFVQQLRVVHQRAKKSRK